MADYRQLLIRAIGALSENNGAQRREVYEKARKALVAQLRSISPPLPAREITQHRLELEDCIRQVEQEATESILGGLKKLDDEPVSIPPEPVASARPAPVAPAPEPVAPVSAPITAQKADMPPTPEPAPVAPPPVPDAAPIPAPKSAEIADLAAALEDEQAATLAPQAPDEPTSDEEFEVEDDVSSIDAIIARAEAARAHNPLVDSGPVAPKPIPAPLPARPPAASTAPKAAPAIFETAASTSVSDNAVGAAMSRVREVEFEPPHVEQSNGHDDSQLAIDRAIAMLDREARGESSDDTETEESDDDEEEELIGPPRPDNAMITGDNRFVSNGDDEKGGGNALMIFLVLAVLLLAGAGGAGYWAWREGYVDLDALFAQGAAVTQPTDQSTLPGDGGELLGDSGPGNTVTGPVTPTPTETLTSADQLTGVDNEAVPSAQSADDANKVEDRLITEAPSATDAPIDSTAPDNAAVTQGVAQSLLLEASADGTTGAVPFSGTVSWQREADELGQPTLIGTASIPARNLSVTVLIRRNADPTLPASHLVEIQFETSETFVGGTIASFGGILLKNEELVPGRPLVGAPARVFENMFLFALSAAEPDMRINLPLLQNNKWMDLAIIYGTGRQAIITLEKDTAAQTMFTDVLAIWAQADASEAASNQ